MQQIMSIILFHMTKDLDAETMQPFIVMIREIGCPAITPDAEGRAVISAPLCTDCGLCAYLCPVKAIKSGDNND